MNKGDIKVGMRVRINPEYKYKPSARNLARVKTGTAVRLTPVGAFVLRDGNKNPTCYTAKELEPE